MNRKNWFIALVATVVTCFLVYLFFTAVFDTSKVEAKARSLIGKQESEIESVLGKPWKVMSAKEFNEQEKTDLLTSYAPKLIPDAKEKVYYFDHFPTIILLFVKDKNVTDVYIGKS